MSATPGCVALQAASPDAVLVCDPDWIQALGKRIFRTHIKALSSRGCARQSAAAHSAFSLFPTGLHSLGIGVLE